MIDLTLKCTSCGSVSEFDINKKACDKCGNGLTIEAEHIHTSETSANLNGIWKHMWTLPRIGERFRITLGEGNTTLHEGSRIKREIKVDRLWFKDETVEPTGSYLDRSSALFASTALQIGCTKIITYSTGNLGASLAAYSSKAGLKMQAHIRPGIDLGKLYQMIAYGAQVTVAQNLKEKSKEVQGTAIATEYDPIVNEAKKTIMLEIFCQLSQDLPDYMILPMGQGGLAYSTYKMLKELKTTGASEDAKTKIVGVQPEGCAPIVKAFEKGLEHVESDSRFKTRVYDLNVAEPKFGNAALKAIRETQGLAVSVDEEEILDATSLLAENEGILAESAASLAIAGLIKLKKAGEIRGDEKVVCVITGSGLKDPKVMKKIAVRKSNLSALIEDLSGNRPLGDTKLAILKLLSERGMYGYQLWKQVKERDKIDVEIPTIYQHLSELIRLGYVKRTESKTILGRRREYYSLTEKGEAIA